MMSVTGIRSCGWRTSRVHLSHYSRGTRLHQVGTSALYALQKPACPRLYSERADYSTTPSATGPDDSSETCVHQSIIESFPGQMSFGCTYGSGAFPQKSNAASEKTMLDFIIAVDNASAWHQDNLARNAHHYSWPIRFINSGKFIHYISNCGAGIFYNSHVEHEGHLIKYGVIQTDALVQDLVDWTSLYTAGRLHKPVRILKCNSAVAEAYNTNLISALSIAGTVLPPKFTERDLYLQIAQLSYSGDLRMVVGENKNKVQNIVDGHLDAFQNLYQPFFNSAGVYKGDDELFFRNQNTTWVPQHLVDVYRDQYGQDLRIALLHEQTDSLHPLLIAIHSVVRSVSTRQMLVGLLTSSPTKVITYIKEKLTKMFQGMNQT